MKEGDNTLYRLQLAVFFYAYALEASNSQGIYTALIRAAVIGEYNSIGTEGKARRGAIYALLWHCLQAARKGIAPYARKRAYNRARLKGDTDTAAYVPSAYTGNRG